MKLSALAAKPQLQKVIVNDEELVSKYGEPIEYWTWDRYPAEMYFKLSGIDAGKPGQLFDAISPIVLDEVGDPILKDGNMLPFDVMMKVLESAIGTLGNANTTGKETTS